MNRSSSQQAAKRGRPKGTGIDDDQILRQLAAMMRIERDLNPTTAIRRIGVTNASVIRRLRDKLKRVSPSQKVINAQTLLIKKTTLAEPSPRTKKAPQKRQPNQQPSRARPAPDNKPKLSTAPKSIGPDIVAKAANEQGKQLPPQSKPEAIHLATADPTEEKKSAPKQASPNHNLDALRLTLELAVTMARLQRQLFDHTMATTPLGLIFRGQAMFAEFLATAMLSHQAILQKPPTTETK